MKKVQSGFTLIELLVVISIIGLLAAVVLVSLNSARAKSRDAQRGANLHQLATALEVYFNDNNSYPSTAGSWWGECTSYGSHALSGSSGYIPNMTPTYIARLPHDPNTNAGGNGSACYLYASNGTDYKLLAHVIPESYPTNSVFYDPIRPTWAWQVSSSGASNW